MVKMEGQGQAAHRLYTIYKIPRGGNNGSNVWLTTSYLTTSYLTTSCLCAIINGTQLDYVSSTLPNRGETAIGGERKFHMFLIRERKFHCLERGNSTLYIYVIII